MNTIEYSLRFLLKRKYPISIEDMKSIGVAIKQVGGNYQPVRDTLWQEVYQVVSDFMYSNSRPSTYTNRMAVIVSQAYIEVGDIAYVDGGGTLPMDEDTLALAKSELDAQLGFMDNLFQTLYQLRKDGDYDAISLAFDKANSWASALDGFYNSIKLAGAGNKMLTWNLGNTEHHCDSCLSLDGQRHRASWYISHGYIPRKPGSNTDCGGYHCDCSLQDDNGEEFGI